jgi:hypothetical protein
MHITCCVLCSRTSGSATIRGCIGRFFEAFPSPSACLQGCPQAMAALLHPLGLTQARLAAVRAVAQVGSSCCWMHGQAVPRRNATVLQLMDAVVQAR